MGTAIHSKNSIPGALPNHDLSLEGGFIIAEYDLSEPYQFKRDVTIYFIATKVNMEEIDPRGPMTANCVHPPLYHIENIRRQWASEFSE